MNYEEQIALNVAKKAHQGQKDKSRKDYILHPLQVYEYCFTSNGKIAALLHDVVEDSDITLQQLLDIGINKEVVNAVNCLTKRENEKLNDYYERISTSDIAIEVKFADMRHNADESRWPAELQDIGKKNNKRYHDRAIKLRKLIGEEKAKALTSLDTYKWLIEK